MVASHSLIEISPGINPTPDNTENMSLHWVNGDKIRFYDGKPQKLGGWEKIDFENNAEVLGTPRAIFGFVLENKPWHLIGTEKKLYALLNRQLFNITPLDYARPLKLNVDPISLTKSSKEIAITIPSDTNLQAGSRIRLSGCDDVGGIILLN